MSGNFAVEEIKAASRHLRGTLADDLANDAPNIDSNNEQLIKFHGIYAQDWRDVRRERTQAGLPLEYIFMTRVVIPGGHITSAQWLALNDIADTVADGTLRLTTRQAIQFHGTTKKSLRELATKLDETYMSSFGGCGDVVRNVVSCPDLAVHGDHDLQELADVLAKRFRPATSAYWEIFVDGQRAVDKEIGEHDFYGATYLPRKFKIAIASPGENCVDVYAQDLGIIPIVRDGGVAGYNVTVGGGLGRNYAHDSTFARLGDHLGYVEPAELEALIEAVVATYRDLGNRGDRKRARLKYVVADLGFDEFLKEVLSRFAGQLHPWVSIPTFDSRSDHLGWKENDDHTWQIGVRVAAGRVRDSETSRTKTALRTIAQALDVRFLLTPQQDIIIDGVKSEDKAIVAEFLRSHGVMREDQLTFLERTALACPALPTCGQALTEAEREFPRVVTELVALTSKHQVENRPLVVRMTGCPNGCARPAVAEIGIVGRTKSTYDIHIGGSAGGTRLAKIWREKVKREDIAPTLEPLVARWSKEALIGESFGDFVERVAPWE